MSLKILALYFRRMRNDEHFQFFTYFLAIVNAVGAAKLKIQQLIDAFISLLGQEDEALKKIMKSDLTTEINDADVKRDLLFRGMADANRSALNHFKPSVHLAARRMQIVFDTYGNVSIKPVDEETSAVYNLLKELSTNHEADMEAVGLNDWYEELYTVNRRVEQLVLDRNSEADSRTDLVLRQVRGEVEKSYRAIVRRVEALMEVEGETEGAPYAAFIHELNTLIERYRLHLAQREGRAAAKKKKEEEQKPEKPTEPKPDAPAE